MSVRPSNITSVKDLSGLGMCIHIRKFKNTPDEIERLKAAGMKYVRVSVTWNATEQTRGVYDWSYYDEQLKPIVDAGLHPVIILGLSNSLYIDDNGKHVPPRTPEQIEAFVKWAAAATEHFAPLNPIMEIWNEPDIPQFWNPKPKAEEYLAMAGPACEAMRKAVPDATILGGAIGDVAREKDKHSQVFTRTMMQDKQFMNCIDAVSIHPYWFLYPELILDSVPFYHAMADEAAAAGGVVRRPYVVSEVGYTTYLPKDKPRIDDRLKAALTVRMAMVTLLGDMPLTLFYSWQDVGNNMLEKEHRFGLTDIDGNDRPAATALNTLQALIGDKKLEQRIESQKDTYVLVFKGDDGARTLIAWNSVGTTTLGFESDITVKGKSMLGKTVKFKPKDGRIRIPLTGEPFYLPIKTGDLPTLSFQ